MEKYNNENGTYNIYRVKIGKKKVLIRFIGKQLEELFRYYKIPYEIVEYSRLYSSEEE